MSVSRARARRLNLRRRLSPLAFHASRAWFTFYINHSDDGGDVDDSSGAVYYVWSSSSSSVDGRCEKRVRVCAIFAKPAARSTTTALRNSLAGVRLERQSSHSSSNVRVDILQTLRVCVCVVACPGNGGRVVVVCVCVCGSVLANGADGRRVRPRSRRLDCLLCVLYWVL